MKVSLSRYLATNLRHPNVASEANAITDFLVGTVVAVFFFYLGLGNLNLP